MYIERLPSFFGVSLRASFPGLVLMLVLAIAAALSPPIVAYPLIFIGTGVVWSMITFMTNASFAIVIDELRRRPLEDVTADDVARGLRQRLGLDANASWFRTFRTLARFYFGAELKSRAGTGDLAFLIAFLESRSPSELGERGTQLVRSSKRTYDWIRFSIFAAVFLPILIEAGVIYSVASQLGAQQPGDLATIFGLALLPLNAVLCNPIFSSALALLYFRARQANGEDVGLAAVVPGRL